MGADTTYADTLRAPDRDYLKREVYDAVGVMEKFRKGNRLPKNSTFSKPDQTIDETSRMTAKETIAFNQAKTILLDWVESVVAVNTTIWHQLQNHGTINAEFLEFCHKRGFDVSSEKYSIQQLHEKAKKPEMYAPALPDQNSSITVSIIQDAEKLLLHNLSLLQNLHALHYLSQEARDFLKEMNRQCIHFADPDFIHVWNKLQEFNYQRGLCQGYVDEIVSK